MTTAAASSPSITQPDSRMSRYARHQPAIMAAMPMVIQCTPMSSDSPLSAAAEKLPTSAANPVANPR